MRYFILLLVVAIAACDSLASEPAPLVPKIRDSVQPEIDRHLGNAQKAALAKLAGADSIPAFGKPALSKRVATDHWGALIDAEKRGLSLAAAAAKGLKNLGGVLHCAELFLDHPDAAKSDNVVRGRLVTLDDHLDYIVKVLDSAARWRNKAIEKLSERQRAELFDRNVKLIRGFGPQSRLNKRRLQVLADEMLHFTHWQETVNRRAFAAAVRTFLELTAPSYLDELKTVMNTAAPVVGDAPNGITGELLAVRETRHGLIVLAGSKANRYQLDQPVAFLADLGGDDTYQGTIASSVDVAHPFSMLVDFSGNDRYQAAKLGLATGRLGCGCVIDRAGNDSYQAAAGGGGCGLMGVGLLVDEAGRDTYIGTGRFTLGAALAGTGLILDMGGDNSYEAPGYSLGLGGPGGVGAIVDVAGNDRYRCGFQFGSSYNSADAPSAKPGDANYQYDAFGLGAGIGRRIHPFRKEGGRYNLAGGVGVWIDLAGDDRSESSNFSQACGYFFGIGVKLDLRGNDHHNAGRFGLAGGAHFGMGLALDYEGDDGYAPGGPVFTGACAWDRSVFLMADGRGNDVYDFSKSSGPGRGDGGSFGLFADLEGRDRYRLSGTHGAASETGIGVFFDGAGEDVYPVGDGSKSEGNGTTKTDGSGGLVRDR